jgi:predicted nucleic acid-binding protein
MHDAVISDASCLIVLSRIDAISLLKSVFDSVTTTPQVAEEVGLDLPSWIQISKPNNTDLIDAMPSSVDIGEASAIALALELPNSTLIIDDLSARNYARRLGIDVTGTIGVLVKAKIEGHIASIRPFVEAIRTTNFRFSETVEKNAFILAGEDHK